MNPIGLPRHESPTDPNPIEDQAAEYAQAQVDSVPPVIAQALHDTHPDWVVETVELLTAERVKVLEGRAGDARAESVLAAREFYRSVA